MAKRIANPEMVEKLNDSLNPALQFITPSNINECEVVLGGYYRIGKLVIVNVRINKKVSNPVFLYDLPHCAINGNVTLAGFYGTNNTYVPNYIAERAGFQQSQLVVTGSDTGNTIRLCGCYITDDE